LSRFWLLAICLLFHAISAHAQSAEVKLFRKNGTEANWCKATNQIAYTTRGPDNLWGIHVSFPSGEKDVWITENNPVLPPYHKGTPDWHPSGRYILFVAEKAKHPGPHKWSIPGIGNYTDIWLMTPDGKQAWQLTNTPVSSHVGIIIPFFSHDGKKIVWAQRYGDVSLLNQKQICGWWDLKVADFVDTPGNPHLANIRTIRPAGAKAFNESYGFTPDDRSIIFCSDYNQPSFWSSQIFTCSAEDGSNIKQLTEKAYNEHAFYSTDGKHIVWMTTMGNFGGTDWWMMDADGSNKHRLTNFNKSGHPEYSRKRKTACLGGFGPDNNAFVGGVLDSIFSQTGNIYMVNLK